jgi:hypothetical protein
MTAANARIAEPGTDPAMTHNNARKYDAGAARQAYLERVVRKAPPLSPGQRAKLGALLAPVAVPVTRGKGVRHERPAA